MKRTMASFLLIASLAACGGGGAPEGTASPAAPLAQTKMGSPGAVGPVPASSPAPGATAATQHEIRGRIEAIPRERVSVTLTHEEIPGVMAAMANMEYGIADPAILDGLAAGDSFEGRLEARSGGYVVVALRKR